MTPEGLTAPHSAARPRRMLHIQLFRKVTRVVNVYPKVMHGAFQLGVPQEDLYSSQVLRFFVDHGGLAAAQRVRSACGGVKTKLRHPVMQDPCVLPSADVRGCMDTAWEPIVLLTKSGLLHPGFEAFPGSRCDLKLNRAMRLALHDYRAM